MFTDFLYRIRAIFRPKSMDGELDEELRFHVERQCEKYMRSGLTAAEAMRRVRLEFGGAVQVTEECREARGIRALETSWQDLRYAIRTLRKNPAFSCVALLTVALGIGANTAMFSVVDAVLLRPLPYADPDRLIVLNETTPRVGLVSVSYPNFLDWRAQSHSFSAMAGVSGTGFNFAGAGRPETIRGQAVSSNFLSMMGLRPVIGRDFTAAEDGPGTPAVAMLSYELWQSHFGGQQNVIGRNITLDGRSFAVIAVLPRSFRSTGECDVLIPAGVWLTGDDGVMSRGNRGNMIVVARLRNGVSLRSARAEMEGIAARLAAAYPEANDEFSVVLEPIRELFVGDVRASILVLFAAVLFVLLIACANVANLFLMRSAGRAREFALRMAIGATRGRIIRQMLVESLVVAFCGGLLGVGLAVAAIQAIPSLVPAATLGQADLNLNGAVLAFAAAATVLVAVAFGLAPALHSSHAAVQCRLQEGGKTTARRRQQRWRGALVIGEIGLSVILLAGAGLMLKSLYLLLAVDSGFRPERLLRVEIGLTAPQYAESANFRRAFWRRALDGIRALPGVESAVYGTGLPLTNDHSRADVFIEGMHLASPGSLPHPDVHTVSPGYARTLGIRLVRGREFHESDSATSQRVGMINERMARECFPGQDPIGKRFMFGKPNGSDPPRWLTIVGVVGDTRLYGLDNPSRLEVYRSMTQLAPEEGDVVIQTRGDPVALAASVRAVISSIDREQPISSITTMEQVVRESVGSRRVTLVLLAVFSALALVLAGIGIYGVIAYSVAQRTREIGIRIALGADRGDVMAMVLFQGARIAAAGVVIGIVSAVWLTRFLENLLFSVKPSDPVTFVAVGLLLAMVAVVACWVPARRALRVDPIVALRYE